MKKELDTHLENLSSDLDEYQILLVKIYIVGQLLKIGEDDNSILEAYLYDDLMV